MLFIFKHSYDSYKVKVYVSWCIFLAFVPIEDKTPQPYKEKPPVWSMSFQQYNKQRCVYGSIYNAPTTQAHTRHMHCTQKRKPQRAKMGKASAVCLSRRRARSSGKQFPSTLSLLRPVNAEEWLKNCRQKGKDRCEEHMMPFTRGGTLSLNAAKNTKARSDCISWPHHKNDTEKCQTLAAVYTIQGGIWCVENARTRWRGHARSLGSGCCGTRAPAAAQESNTARGAADRVQKYARGGSGGGRGAQFTPHAPCIAANQSILPRRESESLATPSSLSAVLLPPPHGHGVLANRATPCPAYLYRRRLRVHVCESAAATSGRCQGSQSLSLIRDISHQESERDETQLLWPKEISRQRSLPAIIPPLSCATRKSYQPMNTRKSEIIAM